MRHFFVSYGANRHKATTLTPSYHAEGYSPDDNRFDLRPFLYPAGWERDVAAMEAEVVAMEAGDAAAAEAGEAA